MGLTDKLTDLMSSLGPKAKGFGAGIGSGHGMVSSDNMIVAKPAIVSHTGQIFFSFIAMCCFASVASFQAKWNVGPSGLSVFALFVAILGIVLPGFMLLVPLAYERYDKFIRLSRTLKEARVRSILTGTGVLFSLLIAFVVTISAWTQPGCKDANQDPSAEANGDDFKKALPGWCTTKKAGAIFFWFAFAFWGGSLALLILDWRSGRLYQYHRDQPFQPPIRTHDEEELEAEDDYEHIPPARRTTSRPTGPSSGEAYENDSPSRYDRPSSSSPQRYGGPSQTPLPYTPAAAGRPSMDAYGAFSDPAPSGFGSSSGYGNSNAAGYASPPSRVGRTVSPPPTIPEPDFGRPMVSRTMQYADPYAAVRASIAAGSQQQQQQQQQGTPPSYESYSGYR